MPDFDKLATHVDRLGKLLADRTPRGSAWTQFVGEHWRAIAEMWYPVQDDFDKWLISKEGRQALIEAGGSQAHAMRRAFEAGERKGRRER